MNNFFKNIFIQAPKTIPETVQKHLSDKFPGAVNIEWEFKDGIFESVFYLNEVEHIANISNTKGIIEYKKNMNINELPQQVSASENVHGEIMNAIEIHKEGRLLYEIIVRDKKLNRLLLLINPDGELLSWKKI